MPANTLEIYKLKDTRENHNQRPNYNKIQPANDNYN